MEASVLSIRCWEFVTDVVHYTRWYNYTHTLAQTFALLHPAHKRPIRHQSILSATNNNNTRYMAHIQVNLGELAPDIHHQCP